MSLAVTVYFGDNLSLLRVLMVGTLSSIVGIVQSSGFTRCFRSPKRGWNVTGLVIFVASNVAYVYIIMATVAVTSSVDQTNDWSIQYVVSLALDNFLYEIITVFIKYRLEKSVEEGTTSYLVQCLETLCLHAR
jgi:hypothetical protein